MGCCESRHDPSLLQASRSDAFRGGVEDGGSSIQAVETAAEALRLYGSQAGKKGATPAGGLRDVRLALLALPRDPKSVPEVPQLEMSKTVEVLRNEADAADVMLTGLVLMRYLAQRPTNQKNMSECNCVSLVLRSLHLHESNPTLQGVACDTLGNLLQEQANTVQFLRLGGVDAVMAVISSNMSHTRVMEAACFLLGNVASSEEGLKHIAENGGAAVALKVVKAHEQDAELLREILFLISNMAQSPALQAELLNVGGVNTVISVMDNHGTSPEIMAMGCSALDNLLGASDPGGGGGGAGKQAAPLPRAALEVCLRALKMHGSDPAVVRRGAGAVATMGAIQPRSPLLVGNTELIEALVNGGKGAMTGKADAQALVQVSSSLAF